MPRERIHWTVIQRALHRLPSSDARRRRWGEHFQAFALGAVLPDAPYYRDFGRDAAATAVAERLHGTLGEDTFAPLRRWSLLTDAMQGAQQEEQRTLWDGVLSHLIVDQVFHPMVYWYTGDYHHADPNQRSEARRRHRLLETLLDLSVPIVPSIRSISSVASHHSHALSQLLGPFAEACETSAPLWAQSVRDFARFTTLFGSTFLGATCRLASRLSGSLALAEIDALFFYGRPEIPGPLRDHFSFQNPVSGELRTVTLDSLIDEAAARLLAETSGAGTLSVHGGTSLAFDIWQAKYSDARFFSKEGFPLEGLE